MQSRRSRAGDWRKSGFALYPGTPPIIAEPPFIIRFVIERFPIQKNSCPDEIAGSVLRVSPQRAGTVSRDVVGGGPGTVRTESLLLGPLFLPSAPKRRFYGLVQAVQGKT